MRQRKNRCETVIFGLSDDRFWQMARSRLQNVNVCETGFFANLYVRQRFKASCEASISQKVMRQSVPAEGI